MLLSTETPERGYLFPRLHTLTLSPVNAERAQRYIVAMVRARKEAAEVAPINTLKYPRFDDDMILKYELGKIVPNVFRL